MSFADQDLDLGKRLVVVVVVSVDVSSPVSIAVQSTKLSWEVASKG